MGGSWMPPSPPILLRHLANNHGRRFDGGSWFGKNKLWPSMRVCTLQNPDTYHLYGMSACTCSSHIPIPRPKWEVPFHANFHVATDCSQPPVLQVTHHQRCCESWN